MKEPLKTQVAHRLMEIMARKGLKQADLARLTGFHKGYISLVLSSQKNLTLETIEILEKALGEQIVKIG
jgi:transcriptional regulator with XRE-family HTH domain